MSLLIKLDPKLTQPISYSQVLEHGWHPVQYQLHKAAEDPSSVIQTNAGNIVRLWPAVLLAIFFFVARAFCKKYIFNSLGRALGIKSKSKLTKFGYQFWLAAAYTTSTLFGLWAFNSEPFWSWPVTHKSSMVLWEVFENDAVVTAAMWMYYCWGTGFYTAELFAIFVEPKRSDFAEYVLHHITTIGLLTSSAYSYNMRFGCMILFLHDVTDIFLCVAKIFHYANMEFWVNVNFVVFLTSFAWLRLYCFPALLEATLFHAPAVRGFEPGFFFSQTLLCILLVLHIYWFWLVLKMVVRLITGVQGDVRSDDDDEEESVATSEEENSAEAAEQLQKKKKLE